MAYHHLKIFLSPPAYVLASFLPDGSLFYPDALTALSMTVSSKMQFQRLSLGPSKGYRPGQAYPDKFFL